MLPLLVTLMTATPAPDIDRAYRALLEAHGPRLEAGLATTLTQTPLAQRAFPALSFVRASGWAQGGHRRLAPVVFVREGDTLRVVRPLQTNLDDGGYHRRLDTVWLCPLDFDLRVNSSTLGADLRGYEALIAQRPQRCEELLARLKAPPSDAPAFTELVRVLAALALEVEQVTTLVGREDQALDPRLRRLLDVKTPGPSMGEVSWVAAPAPFVPWKVTKAGAAWTGKGAATTGPSVPWLVELESTWGPAFSLTTHHLGFVREFIH